MVWGEERELCKTGSETWRVHHVISLVGRGEELPCAGLSLCIFMSFSQRAYETGFVVPIL